jgi:hypothetical protein
MSAGARRQRTPIIIDVEASGFGGHSYPIEVGVALDVGAERLFIRRV